MSEEDSLQIQIHHRVNCGLRELEDDNIQFLRMKSKNEKRKWTYLLSSRHALF